MSLSLVIVAGRMMFALATAFLFGRNSCGGDANALAGARNASNAALRSGKGRHIWPVAI
jgi:hypothetical protein